MDCRMREVAGGVALAVLTLGCFSDPPAAAEIAVGTSTSATSTTPTTPVAPTSGVPPTTAETGGSSSSSAESDSSSGLGTSSGGGSSSAGSSSGNETTGQTTGVECTDPRMDIEGVCLTPLIVTDAYSVLDDESPFDDLAPCRSLACNADLPLGGGFVQQNVMLQSMLADLGAATWEICGSADPQGSPNTWNVGARCTVATGDIFTASEVFSLDANELLCVSTLCPEGTELVGGGGSWGPDFEATASQPMVAVGGGDDPEAWQVCGGAGGSGPDIEVHAYCAVLPPGVSTEVFEAIEPIEDVGLVCAEATCPSGIAIAGGGDGGALSASFEASQPSSKGDGWRACGRNEMFNGQIRSRVLCYQP